MDRTQQSEKEKSAYSDESKELAVSPQEPLIKDTWKKWLFLGYAISLNSGMFYCLNIPSLLKDQFKALLGGNFGLLLSLPQIPNSFMPFIVGVILDKIGLRKGMFIFTMIVFIGQFIESMGGLKESYATVMTGLFFYQNGTECGSTTISSIVSKWFTGKKLTFALAMIQTNLRVYEIITTYVALPLYEVKNNLFLPLFIGSLVCLMSWLVMSPLAILMDQKLDNQLETRIEGPPPKPRVINLKDLKHFNLLYFCVALHCATGYFNYTSFNTEIPSLLEHYYGLSQQKANSFSSIPFYICFSTPIWGILIDFVGNRLYFLFAANLIAMLSFVSMLLIPSCYTNDCPDTPVLFLVGLGIYLSIYAATIWACVPPIVKKEFIATAFGFVYCTKNIMLSLGPLILEALVGDQSESEFLRLLYFMLGSIIFQVLLSVFMIFWDSRTGSVLNSEKFNKKIEPQPEEQQPLKN